MNNKVIIFIFVIIITGCTQLISPADTPDWVRNLISKFESEPVGNPPQSIWRYEYKDKIVYYVPPQCCDQFSALYDANGNIICAPDGGFTGRGDGKCPDFFKERKNEKLIWQDNRENK